MKPDRDQIWAALQEVKDPEIPVLSLVELGVVRQVDVRADGLVVRMTPTFAGCPAYETMKAEVRRRLEELGAGPVEIQTELFPAWTTDRITQAGRQKLREYGLAPPPLHGGDLEAGLEASVLCPYCGSSRTSLKNQFGPTLCRAIWVCRSCRQPFEQFKPL